jgi:VanZ family protein
VLKKTYLFAALTWTFSILFFCLATFNNLPEIGIKNADKYVHFTFHFGFVLLWFLYFDFNKKTANRFKTILVLFLFSFLFGVAIEIAQKLFTTSRSADVFDVAANTTGTLTASLLIVGYIFIRKEISK